MSHPIADVVSFKRLPSHRYEWLLVGGARIRRLGRGCSTCP
jgi:hypothetical protein